MFKLVLREVSLVFRRLTALLMGPSVFMERAVLVVS